MMDQERPEKNVISRSCLLNNCCQAAKMPDFCQLLEESLRKEYLQIDTVLQTGKALKDFYSLTHFWK